MTIKRNAIEVVVVIAVYFILFYYVSQKDIISALLMAGGQASKFDMILPVLFITLRFFTLVFLPGIIFVMAGSLLYKHKKTK
jgi:hypothetical protein